MNENISLNKETTDLLEENNACIEMDTPTHNCYIKFRYLWISPSLPSGETNDYEDTFYDVPDFTHGKKGTCFRKRTNSGCCATDSFVTQSLLTDYNHTPYCRYYSKETLKSFDSSLQCFLSFTFRRVHINESMYIDRILDKGMGNYTVLTQRWKLSFDESNNDEWISKLSETITAAKAYLQSYKFHDLYFPSTTFTKFMFAMQCRKATYLTYHEIFSHRDLAVKAIEHEIFNMKQKRADDKLSHMYVLYTEEVVSLYCYYYDTGLDENESTKRVEATIEDFLDGTISFDIAPEDEDFV